MLSTIPRPTVRLTAAVARTLTLVSLSQTELTWRLTVEATEIPALRLKPPQMQGGRSPVLDPDRLAAEGDSLVSHVLQQIDRLDLTRRERAIALVLTEALDVTGWLGTPVRRIARACGVAEQDIQSVLARLQRIEPGGLFARSLAECLRLQAIQAGELCPVMTAVLAELPLLATDGADALAAKTGLPPEDVRTVIGRLRAYDPKPGLAFSDHGPIAPPADLLLQRDGKNWSAVVNPNLLTLEIDQRLPDGSAADAWRGAVEGRYRIALAIGNLLVRHQAGWLNGGAMAAITTREIAAQTGFHISTINRGLSALTARMPFGTAPLRKLVSHPVGRDGVSSDELRCRVQNLISAAGDVPVSDAMLSRQLAQDGIRVARRTITKYRAILRAGR